MSSGANDIGMRSGVFVWMACATGLLLLIPLIAMQFTDEVNWSIGDFIIMGLLLFGIGSTAVLVSRKLPRQRRTVVIILSVLTLLWIWAELAVGVFTGIGN